MSWSEQVVWVEGINHPGGDDVKATASYFSPPDQPQKWRIIGYEELYPNGSVDYVEGVYKPVRWVVSLGMVGPNYEKHGQRYWVRVWESKSLETAKTTVERQEGSPPARLPTIPSFEAKVSA